MCVCVCVFPMGIKVIVGVPLSDFFWDGTNTEVAHTTVYLCGTSFTKRPLEILQRQLNGCSYELVCSVVAYTMLKKFKRIARKRKMTKMLHKV